VYAAIQDARDAAMDSMIGPILEGLPIRRVRLRYAAAKSKCLPKSHAAPVIPIGCLSRALA
jgi:hypothetical protein